MLLHATKPTTDHAASGRRTHRPPASSLYTVASCPDDLYPRGAQFAAGVVRDGLAMENWPDGTVFVSHSGARLVVRDRALVPSEVAA